MTAPAYAAPRGRQPSIEWVPIGDLLIDDSYQRSIDGRVSQKLIADIAAAWDWDVLDVLKVSRRPDDRLFVVDGQHRKAAAAMRGDIAQLPCVLKRCAGPADEARLFIASNRGRKRMSPVDDFRAAVGAGDELASTIEGLVTAAGLSIARVAAAAALKPGELAIVGALRSAYAKRGAAMTGRALSLLGQAFGDEVVAGASSLFGALLQIVALTDHDDAELLAALRRGTSRDWVEWGAGRAGGGQTAIIAMRAAIERRIVVAAPPPPPPPPPAKPAATMPSTARRAPIDLNRVPSSMETRASNWRGASQ